MAAGLALALLVASPWWVPWLAKPVAKWLGADLATAQRDGYWRLKVTEVRFEQPGVKIAIDDISLLQPIGWLVERVFPESLTSPGRPAVDAHGCRVEIPDLSSGKPAEMDSTAQALSAALRITRRLSGWVAHARVSGGTVLLLGQTLTIPEAAWARGSLTLRVENDLVPGPLDLQASLRPTDGFDLSLGHEFGSVGIECVEGARGELWQVNGETTLLEGVGQVTAMFAGGWAPDSLSLKTTLARWPEPLAQLPDWLEPLPLAVEITGQGTSFAGSLTASVRLTLPGLGEREVRLRLDAENGPADLNEAGIQRLEVESTGLQIRLLRPVGVLLSPRLGFSTSDFRIESRLDEFVGDSISATGTITGNLSFRPSDGLLPAASLTLTGGNLAVAKYPVGQLALEASLDWPELRLDRFELGDTISSLTATGRVDLATRMLDTLHWEMTGLPAALTNDFLLAKLSARGEITGPLAAPRHRGTLAVEHLRLPGLHPLALDLEWSGERLALSNLIATASATTGELRLQGAVDTELGATPTVRLQLDQLALRRGGQPLLALNDRATVTTRFPPADPEQARLPRIEVSQLELAGDSRRFRLAGAVIWPREGRLEVEAGGLLASDLRDFVAGVPEWIRLDRLALDAGWTNGPVSFDLDSAFRLTPLPGDPLTLDARLSSAGEHLAVEVVEIRRGDEALGAFSGELPLRLEPGAPGPVVRLLPEGRLLARLKAEQDSPLWSELTRWFGVTAVEPSLSVTLTGTGGAPRGHVQFAAREVRSENTIHGVVIPPVEAPKVTATLDDTGKLTAAAEAKLAGQRGTFSATLPLNLAALTNAPAGFGLPDLKPLQARLRLPGWQVAPLAAFAPGFLGPQGELDLDVSVEPGLHLTGRVVLTNLATMPLPPVGVLRQMHATARLNDGGITLETAGVLLGSERLHLAGAWRFGTNGGSGYAFTITGTNLPLARQPDIFLRGDLALKLTGTNLTDAVVSGDVTLRNSLLLRDLQSLVSGNIEAPAARPPFFSISEAPLADWRLNLRVRGEEFLHVVTPVFRGRVSAALQLGGTLREPVALGDVTLPSGTVTFPFGGLKVDSGRVSLSRSNPFVPSLAFQASGMNFGYDVRMDVSGAATAPNVLFSSVPPLSSMQILLMLTSGDIPGDAFSYSSRSRMQQIGMFVGKEFLGKLTGDPENDRLSMRSGEEVTDRGQLTYSIEYRLSPRWALFGQRDRFDSYGAGIKWRVFSK